MSNSSMSSACPLPFLAEADYPATGGHIDGRFCAELEGGYLCCLPCPQTDWVYSNSFNRKMNTAYWLNVPSLALVTFILVTFIVLPPEASYRHYLSVGLAISMILLHLSFMIALGTRPDQCYNAITPSDMYESMPCAWSGALLLMGAMACAVWIMLRSIWTHLRVVWDMEQTPIYFWIAQVLGWGLPSIFLAVCVPIVGLSYRFGGVCVPNQPNAFATWFGWLMGFGCLGAFIQFATFGFCLWVYLKDLIKGTTETSTMGTQNSHYTGGSGQPLQPPRDHRKLAWKRVYRVMKVQWRSMALCTVVIVLVLFYGIYVTKVNAAVSNLSDAQVQEVSDWAFCLILNRGEKDACKLVGPILGLEENALVATFMLAGLIGTLTFFLMVRRSMFGGWWYVLRHPRRAMRNPSVGDEDFMVISPKRKSFGRALDSEKKPHAINTSLASPTTLPHDNMSPIYPMSQISPVSPLEPFTRPEQAGILPDPTESRNSSIVGQPSPIGQNSTNAFGGAKNDGTTLGPIPEAGDVSRRHETTNFFAGGAEDDYDDPYDVPKRARRKQDHIL